MVREESVKRPDNQGSPFRVSSALSLNLPPQSQSVILFQNDKKEKVALTLARTIFSIRGITSYFMKTILLVAEKSSVTIR
jgi:hypothetical protein